jgi:hypothetical protein
MCGKAHGYIGEAGACAKHWIRCRVDPPARKVPRGVPPRLEAVGRDGPVVLPCCSGLLTVLAPEALGATGRCHTCKPPATEKCRLCVDDVGAPDTFSVAGIHSADTTITPNQSACRIAPRAFNKGAEHATASRLPPQVPPLPRLCGHGMRLLQCLNSGVPLPSPAAKGKQPVVPPIPSPASPSLLECLYPGSSL